VLIAKFQYEKKAFRYVTLLMVALEVFTVAILLLAVPMEEYVLIAPTLVLISFITFLFGVTPWFTAHEVHDTYLMVRQGWYYRNRIDLADIKGVIHVENGPWAYGMHFVDGDTVYVNGRTTDLILLELFDVKHRNGKRRRMTRVLFDTIDNRGFLLAIGKGYRMAQERLD
jgi:hypothetical protein